MLIAVLSLQTQYNNANLISDANKKITSITYNPLNLPSVITIANKGTITYLYDAAGNKLQKTTVDNTTTPSKTTTTMYLNGVIYENDKVQLIPQEEGRIRPVRNTTGNITSYAYDYFLKDHLGNVRMLFTDEQFKFVQSSSGAELVGEDQELKVHVKNNMPITKSGYLYVFVSNETQNIDVFFDNLQVTHIRGAILEETHYYPFGLTMAGISSKAAGILENKQKFQEQELDDALGICYYEFKFRPPAIR